MSSSRKITFSLGVVVAAVVLLFPAAAEASTNVVPNPGFEQGGCGNTPVICGWDTYQFMSQDTNNPHSGSASMSLGGINAFSVVAWTDPAFCAATGAGTHPASFWYRNTSDSVYLAASFYQAANCTGPSADEFLGGVAAGDAWQEASGVLVAPAGTQSALFTIGVDDSCDIDCTDPVFGNFDDVDVEGTMPTLPSITSFTPTSGPVGTM
jgi:hypothetical protein